MSEARHDLVHRLFTEAVALSVCERQAFLAAADGDIRVEVEAMLDEDARAVGPLDAALDVGGARFLAGEMARDGEVGDVPPELPERLGKYRVLRQIGEGGMGVVYEAEQDDPKRRVALKVVRTSLVTRGLLQRFRHEARVLGHLRHPGIAQIYEAGSADTGAGGQPYFAMELVEGTTILEYAEKHRLDAASRLELIAQVCDILEYAHQKGVIHRDIKPANLLVTDELSGTGPVRTARPLLKVLDFGVARATDADLNTVTLQTTVGQLVGTVPYMSPEQASGDPAAIDTRSDVYSVGVLAWELLAGRLPYEVRGKMVHEAVRVIREEDASRLSAIDRSWRGDVETIFAKALEKEKTRRYQSAAELAQDIRRYLAHEPIGARPASAAYQIQKFARRNKTLVTGVVATLVVAVTGAAVATWFAVDAHRTATAARRASYVSGLTAAMTSLQQGELAATARYLDALPVEHRGWEYDYLRSRMTHHVDEWPGGSPLASAIHGGTPVFDASGAMMYAVCEDRSIGRWDVATGRHLDSLSLDVRDDELGWRVVLHGPSSRAAVPRDGNAIDIRDLGSGEVLERIATAEAPRVLAWSRDGGQLLFAAGDALHVRDGSGVRRIGEGYSPRLADFSPDGTRVACSSGDRIMLIDPATGQLLVESPSLHNASTVLTFSPDGGRLAVGGLYGNDYLLDAHSLEVLRPLAAHTGVIWSMQWDRSGRLITGSADGTLRIWERGTSASHRVCAAAPLEAGATPALALLPGVDAVVVGGLPDPGVRVVPLEDPAVLHGHETFVYRVAFTPDGRWLISAGFASGVIRRWDVRTGEGFELPGPAPEHTREPYVGFSSDGGRMYAATRFGRVRWDVETWSRTTVVEAPDGDLRLLDGPADVDFTVRHSIDTTRDGSRTAICAGDLVNVHAARREVGELVVGDWIGALRGHVGAVHCVAFSPDGTRLATGGVDRTVRIWDARTFEELLVLRGHDEYVSDLEFNPDGTLLASASGDRTVRLWDSLPLHERRGRAGESGTRTE